MIYCTYFIHTEEGLILRDHCITRLCKDLHQHLLVQTVQWHHHRQTAHKLWDHAELDEVPCFNVPQEPVLFLDLCHCIQFIP